MESGLDMTKITNWENVEEFADGELHSKSRGLWWSTRTRVNCKRQIAPYLIFEIRRYLTPEIILVISVKIARGM